MCVFNAFFSLFDYICIITLSTFVLRNGDPRLLSFIFFLLISSSPSAYPALGLINSSLGYSLQGDMINDGQGLSLLYCIDLTLPFLHLNRIRNVSWFISYYYFIHPSPSPVAGTVWDHNNYIITDLEEVNEGDEWSMEVDLRSREKEKRTLHFFVRGEQQKGFIKGVPNIVEFGV